MEKSRIMQLPIYKNQSGEFLTKKDIVSNFPHNFNINEEKSYEYATTSGTTSDRMEIIRKPNWWNDEYKRTYSNNKKLKKCYNEKLHKIIFTTAQCSNLVCFVEKPPMEKRIFGNTLYINNTFNPWDWTKNDIRTMIKEFNMYKPYYLDADPVYLGIFLYLKDKYNIKTKLHCPKIITLSYEFVTRNMRKFISKHFETDIKNLYGTTEFGYAFLENESGKMQICKDLISIHLLPVCPMNNIYSIVVDSFKNEYMPLINYRVGDLVLATKEEYEKFEQNGIVSEMAGREKDLIDNRISFSMFDNIICSVTDKILLYQFYFISDNDCHFKYISTDKRELSKLECNTIMDKLADINFKCQIHFNKVDELTPEISGKFSIVKKQI